MSLRELFATTRREGGRHPLGPVLYRLSARRPVYRRLVAGGVLAGCLVILGVAACVHPDRRGMASHRQLGLPPCSMMALFGYPCPTCGMTTAFAHLVRGEVISAFRAQPAGLVLATATIVTAVLSLDAVLTGCIWAINWYRVPPGRLALLLVLLIGGGWAYKLVAGLLSGEFPATP